jgi:hypothetical protein
MRKIYYLPIVILVILSLILGCGGNDLEDPTGNGNGDGAVQFVGSVTVKSTQTDINGNYDGLSTFPNRDGIEIKLWLTSEYGGDVLIDSQITENGEFTLTGEDNGTYRITAKVNDFIRAEMDSTITVFESDMDETFTLSPIVFGPYSEENHPFLKTEWARPNPASSEVTFLFTTYDSGEITLKIYDTTGELVNVLMENVPELPGSHNVVWDFTNGSGDKVEDDVYFFVLKWIDPDNPSEYRVHVGTVIKG